MEHGANGHAKEQLHTEMAIKTEIEEAAISTAYVEIEINIKQLKQDPGIVQYVKNEPALLVKEDILENSTQGTNEQQIALSTSRNTITGRISKPADNVEQGELLQVKEKLKDVDLDIGPTVPQYLDSQYGTDQIKVFKQENNSVKNLSRIDDVQITKDVKVDTIESSWKDKTVLAQCNSSTVIKGGSLSETCDLCKKTYKNKTTYRSHMKRVHGTSHLECPECTKYFRCQQYLNEHIVNVHGTSRLKCPVCNKRFRCRQYLNEHILNVHGHQEECDACGKVFKCKRNLAKHIRFIHKNKTSDNAVVVERNSITTIKGVMHEGSKHIYTCDVCKKSFNTKEAIKAHLKHVHETSHLICSECNKHFRCQKYLHNHIVNVHSQNQHKCEICKKVFKSLKVLSRHIKFVHEHKTEDSPNLPYTCDYCLKKFRWKYLLVSHQEKLHGNKTFRCKLCKKNFGCQLYLSRHAKRLHGLVENIHQRYSCDKCLQLCMSKNDLIYHRNQVHGTKSH